MENGQRCEQITPENKSRCQEDPITAMHAYRNDGSIERDMTHKINILVQERETMTRYFKSI